MTGPAAPGGRTTLAPPSAVGSASPSPAARQPTRPVPDPAPDTARLSLDPANVRRAGIHGGWWPRSLDAAAELPGLIAEIGTRAGRVSRIALQVDAFSNIPHRLDIGGRRVSVGWFKYMDKHTAIVTMADRDDLVLLVIPPLDSPEAAARALDLAASDRRAGPPEAILESAGAGSDTGNGSGNVTG